MISPHPLVKKKCNPYFVGPFRQSYSKPVGNTHRFR